MRASEPPLGQVGGERPEQPHRARLTRLCCLDTALTIRLPGLLAICFNPERKLQDRQLRRMEDKDLGEDRSFHDLVLVGGRE